MAIITKNLTVKFSNKVIAADNVNLYIKSGIYGLLGENGAGKTTLMRVLTTILNPTNGEVFLDDIKYCEQNFKEIQRRIGYLPQELNLYPNLTVRESLEYLGELSGLSKKTCKERTDYYLEKTNLQEHQKKKNKQLSGGMKRRVGLAQALLHNPDVLIVDEPTTGLDPEERIRIRNLIVDFSAERVVLFSTHVVEDLAATCNQLAIMKKGNILYDGHIKELISQARNHIWICETNNESEIKEIERNYHITSKQFTERGVLYKVISNDKPDFESKAADVSLEDAYIYMSNL